MGSSWDCENNSLLYQQSSQFSKRLNDRAVCVREETDRVVGDRPQSRATLRLLPAPSSAQDLHENSAEDGGLSL